MQTAHVSGQHLDLTVRVGCRLVYETATTATLLLNLRPRTDPGHSVQEEQLLLGDELASDEFVDSHGNTVERVVLGPGRTEIRHDALVSVSSLPDDRDFAMALPIAPCDLPPGVLRYTLPSRYCDSDKLMNFAWQQFGQVENGVMRVQAISDWLHKNIEYRFGSGSPDLSAWDVLQRGHGVCRDFAHMLIALCRTFNLPARYVTGHLPDIGVPDPEGHMDFHAFVALVMALPQNRRLTWLSRAWGVAESAVRLEKSMVNRLDGWGAVRLNT